MRGFFPVRSEHIHVVNLPTVTVFQNTLQICSPLSVADHFLSTNGAVKHATFCWKQQKSPLQKEGGLEDLLAALKKNEVWFEFQTLSCFSLNL